MSDRHSKSRDMRRGGDARSDGTIERLLALRDPLCRAELAASRITRDAWCEPQELAAEIRHALRELDGRIDTLVAGLRTPASAEFAHTSASPIVLDVLRRMHPVLRTSDVSAEWLPPDPACARMFEGIEPALLRRAVLVALRVAIASLREGGRVLLEAVTGRAEPMLDLAAGHAGQPAALRSADSEERFGLRLRRFPDPLRTRPSEIASAPTAAARATLEALRDCAADLGGWLDVRIDPDSTLPALYLWIGPANETHSLDELRELVESDERDDSEESERTQ